MVFLQYLEIQIVQGQDPLEQMRYIRNQIS